LILKEIIAVSPFNHIAPVFAIIGPDLLRKLNMVSDAVSDLICGKWPKNQVKMGIYSN
jgi:hypothetical protein